MKIKVLLTKFKVSIKPYKFLALLLVVNLIFSCARVPYHFGYKIERENTLKLKKQEPQFERGEPNTLLDGLGHYVISLPSKLILWNWKIDNHNISEDTEEKLRQYFADNDLYNVKVRLNQYNPGGEWSRLVNNKAVGTGWRYTIGAISVLFYTILPGRLIGGDHYNAYTNTVNLYSDLKSVSVHEGGHAKDFAQKTYKGTYAFLYIFPILPLFYEARATGDAIGYDRVRCLIEDEKEDYKVLYPAYMTYVAGEGLNWVSTSIWVYYAVYAALVIPGHIIGRIKASRVEKRSSCFKNDVDMEDNGNQEKLGEIISAHPGSVIYSFELQYLQ